jgi:hypothetical protein
MMSKALVAKNCENCTCSTSLESMPRKVNNIYYLSEMGRPRSE